MKISDFIFQFDSGPGKERGLCRVRLFVTRDRRVASVLTDLTDVGFGSTGFNVTNGVEIIRKALIDRGFVANDAIVIEHYESRKHNNYEFSSFSRATFDIVTFSQNNTPSWKPIDVADVCGCLDCENAEFEVATEENVRLMTEIESIRNTLDPFSGSPRLEEPEVVNRRADIQARMISKDTLARTIDSGAGEAELQRLLKADLSVFAEVYARPADEYICLSEFPIGDGFVDFAVLSGRSRMDVTFIEIKGADFHLATAGSYKNFSSKANEAIQQIRKRVGIVYRDMKTFRCSVHQIRQRIEAGESLYGALIGPRAELKVDPNKDINIHCVVIAGRTRNDLEESLQRHDYEWSAKPPVKVETWDTWLRKLRRS